MKFSKNKGEEMFFRAFSATSYSPLRAELTFQIEYEASIVIAHGNREYLERMLHAQTLAESIYQEVEFFGSVPRELSNIVRMYFYSNERSLSAVVAEVLSDPDNEDLLKSILEPINERWRNILTESAKL